MRIPVSWLKEFVEVDMSVEELAHRLEMAGLGVEAIEEVGDDVVLDLEVTPNRADWLSIIGVAREVAAITDARCQMSDARCTETGDDITRYAKVVIEDPDLCPRYSARLVTGVTVDESPDWMKRRLEACGLRPINNIVDITNYVLLELGQPLHAFDFRTLKEGTIVVRRARLGETLVTLDEQLRELTEEMLVIADAQRPVAIAGVMGGLETEVTWVTKDVLIESAHFDRKSIRFTAKRLGMRTEASYRFERWVDPSGTVKAADRAAQLMAELAGGTVHKGVIDVYPKRIEPVQVTLRVERVGKLLGVRLNPGEVATMLRRLGMEVSGTYVLTCVVPTFRRDIQREADLIEEVARLYGYDKIPMTLPEGISERAGDSEGRKFERFAKEVLMRCGLQELVTFSLTEPNEQARWRLEVGESVTRYPGESVPNHPIIQSPLKLRNPLTSDFTMLRTAMLPSMLAVMERNQRRGNTNIWAFEIGKAYFLMTNEPMTNDQSNPPVSQFPSSPVPQFPSSPVPQFPSSPALEGRRLCIGLMGRAFGSRWNLPEEPADFFTLKGIVENLMNALGIEQAEFRPAQHPSLHPFRAAEVIVGGESVGVLGELHPELHAEAEFSQRVYLAELNLDALAVRANLARTYQPLPEHPAAIRDVAVVVPFEEAAASVMQVIREMGGDVVEKVEPFDEYRGAPVEEGKKSVAFSLTLRAKERTLSGEEVEGMMQRIKDALREKGWQIRE